MGFNSITFLSIFLPVAITGFFLSPPNVRNFFLLICSLIFYAWGEPKFVFVALASGIADWLLGRFLVGTSNPKIRKLCLLVSIILNIGILFTVKYLDFFINNMNILLSVVNIRIRTTGMALPIGISFIAFEKITYTADLYRGDGKVAKSLSDYLVYVFLFPKLLAGPIVKYHEIADQLSRRIVSLPELMEGLARFAVGLFKKMFIADPMGKLADQLFTLPTSSLSTWDAWLAALGFSVQIFFDFSAYSDMAIGLARVFGFRLRENFNQPYTSGSFTEFWHRWHISLSSWIREYLYIPLGGNRVSTRRMYANLVLCFLASGLWHGASWTYVIWGAYHGMFLVFDRVIASSRVIASGRWQGRFPSLLQSSATFLLVVIGWVLFRCPSIEQAFAMMSVMFDPWTGTIPSDAIVISPDSYVILSLGLLMGFAPFDPLWGFVKGASDGWGVRVLASRTLVVLLMILGIGSVMASSFTPFIYFRF